MRFRSIAAVAAATSLLTTGPLALQAENFTTAEEVRPILESIKDKWIAIRVEGSEDYVFFTPIVSWRCGVQAVQFGFNDEPPTRKLEMADCHTEFSNPNVMVDTDPIPLVKAPAKSVESVTIRMMYDDGSLSESIIPRKQVLIP
ncbi:MAG: hypothetical protein JXQ91_13640 [Vannielia sp.]|uniref:hypothetical protein n=1 Tax=Rhodobacterales TaxID=204455 RepID=UPI0020956E0A|nr:hypothetical protein [Oceanicola sp. 502str15]MCO6382926.1 hypothetical protein [Oceanicola sp. 502str15]